MHNALFCKLHRCRAKLFSSDKTDLRAVVHLHYVEGYSTDEAAALSWDAAPPRRARAFTAPAST